MAGAAREGRERSGEPPRRARRLGKAGEPEDLGGGGRLQSQDSLAITRARLARQRENARATLLNQINSMQARAPARARAGEPAPIGGQGRSVQQDQGREGVSKLAILTHGLRGCSDALRLLRGRQASSAARRARSASSAGESASAPGGRRRAAAPRRGSAGGSGAAPAPAPASLCGGRARRGRKSTLMGPPKSTNGPPRAGRGGGHHREHRGQRQGRAQGCAAPRAARPPGAPRTRMRNARGGRPWLRSGGRCSVGLHMRERLRTRQALAPVGLSGRQSPAPRRTTGTAAGTPAPHARLSRSPSLASTAAGGGRQARLHQPLTLPYPTLTARARQA